MEKKETEKGMKVVFIAGPYKAPTIFQTMQNILEARRIALKYWALGYAVICPHSNSAFFDGSIVDIAELGREEPWYDGDKEFVRRSDIVVAMHGWWNSKGATAEIELAKELNKHIIFEKEEE